MAARKRANTRAAAEKSAPVKTTERAEVAAVATEQAAAASVPIKTKPKKVIVCYNSPTGIIFDLPLPGGRVKKVLVNGNAVALRGKERAGALPVGAFGMTAVDSEDWEAIVARYGRMKIFVNGLIFASNDRDSAQAEADERKELRNGFEPVDVDNPKRGSKSSPDNEI